MLSTEDTRSIYMFLFNKLPITGSLLLMDIEVNPLSTEQSLKQPL